jgi:hypothetical protein
MNIKDYLHLYIGASYIKKWLHGKNHQPDTRKKMGKISHSSLNLIYKAASEPEYWEVRLILWPLGSMTEKEYKMWEEELSPPSVTGTSDFMKNEAARTNYLHKQGFDLYGLIDAGLAIDATILLGSRADKLARFIKMNKVQAIAALSEGKKLTHDYFQPNEFIYMADGKIFSEDGVMHPKFWELRDTEVWDKYWSVVE